MEPQGDRQARDDYASLLRLTAASLSPIGDTWQHG